MFFQISATQTKKARKYMYRLCSGSPFPSQKNKSRIIIIIILLRKRKRADFLKYCLWLEAQLFVKSNLRQKHFSTSTWVSQADVHRLEPRRNTGPSRELGRLLHVCCGHEGLGRRVAAGSAGAKLQKLVRRRRKGSGSAPA